MGEFLGEGTFGKVYEAIDTKKLRRVAIKVLKKKKIKKNELSKIELKLKNEIKIMKGLKHKNVIELIEVFENKENGTIYLIIEFAGAGSLQQVIESNSTKRLPISEVWRFFTQTIEGLAYVHGQNIVFFF
jgi:serine/threonine protein kinase